MAKKLRDEDLVLNIIVNGNKGKKEINELERAIKDTSSEVRKLKKAQEDLRKEGKQDTEQYKALTVAITEKGKSIQLAEARLIQLRKGMKLTEMSMSDLKSELQRLTKLMNTAVPGSENYIKYKAEVDKLNTRIQELRGNAERTGFSLGNLANKFNQYFAMITAGFITVVAAFTGIKKIITTYAEFDDKLADVSKTTGLLKFEVVDLNNELKKIDTRTQQENLLGLARIAGKLGITGKEDIAAFVRATDQINVALSEDLGGDVEETINEIGKLVDIFKIKDEFGIEKSLLKVGSAINSLGAYSTASEAYLVEFTKRVAGIGPSSGYSIQNILGLAATLDQLGQTAEVSGTTFNDVIPSMFKDTATFARIAGIGLKDFSALLKSDVNEAFIRVLEGLKGNNAGMGEMVKKLNELGIDGTRSTNVLNVLANNTKTLREQQALANREFAKGTSITTEYNIKNQTAAAGLDRAKKALTLLVIELGEKLYPVMTFSVSGFTMFVKVLAALAGFMIDNRKAIITVTAALVGYNAAVLISNLLTGEGIIYKKAEIALAKLKVFWDNAQTASMHLLSAGYALMRGNIAAAKAEMILFNTVTALNPIAVLIAVLTAATVAFISYSKQLTAAQEATKSLLDTEAEAQKSIASQKYDLQQLVKIGRDKTRSDAERLEAIKKLNEVSPEHLGFLNLENIATDKATSAVNNYTEAILKSARVEAARAKLGDIERRRIDLQVNGKGADLSFLQQAATNVMSALGAQTQSAVLGISYQIRNSESAKKVLDEEQKALEAYLNQNSITKPVINDGAPDSVDKQVQTLKTLTTQLSSLKEARENAALGSKEFLSIEKQIAEVEQNLAKYDSSSTYAKAADSAATKAKAKLDALKKEIEAFDTKQEANDPDNDKKLVELNANYQVLLEKAKGHEGEISQLTESYERQRAQRQLEIQEETERKFRASAYDALNESYQEDLDKLKQYHTNRLLEIDNANASEDERAIQKAEADAKYEQDLYNKEQERLTTEALLAAAYASMDDLSIAEKELWADRAIELENKVTDNAIAKQKQVADTTRSTAQERARAEKTLQNTIVSAYAEGFGIIKSLFNQNSVAYKAFFVLEKIAATAKVILNLQQELAAIRLATALQAAGVSAIPVVGVGLANAIRAKGSAEALTAKISAGLALTTIAAQTIGGLESGGSFLDVIRSQDGKRFRAKNDPGKRGYVNTPTVITGETGQEFVLNNRAVNNPTIRPFVDLIDTAQRNGTISTLKLDTLLAQSRNYVRLPGRASGGFIGGTNTTVSQAQQFPTTDPLIIQLLQQNIALQQSLQKQLQRPLKADVSLLGPNGFLAKQAELDSITNNSNI